MAAFPTKRESLNTLLKTVVPYLNDNKARLMIPGPELDEMNDLYGDESTSGTYLYLYKKWADKSGGRTKDVIDDLGDIEEKLKAQLTKMYEDIPASLWNNTDRNTLRRKRGLPRTVTHRTTPIKSNTFMRNKVIGPCEIGIACYADKDSKRPSINRTEGANAIELAILIVDPNNPLPENETSGTVKKTPPKTVRECPYHEIHQKAIIVLKFDPTYRKCDVYIYARLYDTRHPELAGPWSEVLIIPIP